MTTTETILQCGLCHRQHDGAGGLLTWRKVLDLDGLIICACGLEDCAALVRRQLAEAREVRQRQCAGLNRYRASNGGRGGKVAARVPAVGRLPYADADLQEPAPAVAHLPVAARLPAVAHRPADLERDFQASGGADSANKILLEFFRQRENFNRPFRSTDLEEMTRAAGHPSSRMNNRAIWLREQFIPAGLYLDNDPNGSAWGLANGSYYKLCRIEDATSLSEDKKYKLTHPEPEML